MRHLRRHPFSTCDTPRISIYRHPEGEPFVRVFPIWSSVVGVVICLMCEGSIGWTFCTGSFGSLDEVSKTVLPEAEGVKSRMVDSYTVKNYYVYDYIVSQDGRPEKHIKVMGCIGSILAAAVYRCLDPRYTNSHRSVGTTTAL